MGHIKNGFFLFLDIYCSMEKIVKLNESDIVRLIKKVINEQPKEMDPLVAMPNTGDRLNRTQGSKGDVGIVNVLNGKKLDGSLFGNAIDKIDKTSAAYTSALNDFKKLAGEAKNKNLGTITVNIEGGASAVGNAQGYDNNKLAQRRATNFINAIKTDIPNAPFLFNISTKVGKATKRNSPEANAEQYVKISIPNVEKINYKLGQIGRDNTAIRYGQPIQTKSIDIEKNRPYMILKIYYNEGTKEDVINKLYAATRTERTVTTDVTNNAKNCNL